MYEHECVIRSTVPGIKEYFFIDILLVLYMFYTMSLCIFFALETDSLHKVKLS